MLKAWIQSRITITWLIIQVFYSSHTGVATLLDALSPVRDASSRVSWVDDMALVACWTVKRLVSILSCAAGLSWSRKHATWNTPGPFFGYYCVSSWCILCESTETIYSGATDGCSHTKVSSSCFDSKGCTAKCDFYSMKLHCTSPVQSGRVKSNQNVLNETCFLQSHWPKGRW